MGDRKTNVTMWKNRPETVTAGCVKLKGALEDIPSNALHVKLCMNPSRPLDKPKYYLATDSEPVPRGKGEKNRC